MDPASMTTEDMAKMLERRGGADSVAIACRLRLLDKVAKAAAAASAPGVWVYETDPHQANCGRIVLAERVGVVDWVASIRWNGHYLDRVQAAFGEFVAAAWNARAGVAP